MKSSTQILIVLCAIVLMQFVQAWQLASLPERSVAAWALTVSEAEVKRQEKARQAQAAAATAEYVARHAREQAAAAAFEKREFEEALARIPADVPEPKRSEAARALVKMELEGPKEGETQSQYETRMVIRRARMLTFGEP